MAHDDLLAQNLVRLGGRVIEDLVTEASYYFTSLPTGLIDIRVEPFTTPARVAEEISAHAPKLSRGNEAPTMEVDPRLGGASWSTCRNDRGGTTVRFSSRLDMEQFEAEYQRARLDLTSSAGLATALESSMRSFRDVIIPRAVELRDQPDTFSRVLDVEDAWHNWRGMMALVVDDWGFPEEPVWDAAADFFVMLDQLRLHLSHSLSAG